MVFGGSNDLVSHHPLPADPSLTHQPQEMMRDGDPEDLIENGKKAMVIVDRQGSLCSS
jgi:hypothetical protein